MSLPTFTIIVPTYHRPEHLARSLEALARQTFPRDSYEVVVVDDANTPEAAAQVRAVAARTGMQTTYVGQSHGGPANARNSGTRVARGRYLAFTDDDCEPLPEWLAELAPALAAGPGVVVGGLTVNALPDLPGSTASQLLIDYLYQYFEVSRTGARFFATNNLAMWTDNFRALGGFDETFPLAGGEDREFCERAEARGCALGYCERAVVRHWHALTFRRFVRQHFNYGRGADFLHLSRARRSATTVGRTRPNLERLSFYRRLVLYPLSRTPFPRSALLSGLLVISQAAYASGYAYQRWRRARAGATHE